MANLHTIYLIKSLAAEGLPEKIIIMITKANQSYVNKIRNNYIHTDKELTDENRMVMNDKEYKRYIAAKRILSMPELPITGLGEQDIIYMHVLKFFMINKKSIQQLYSNISKAKINRYLMKKDIDICNFNSEIIGIEKKVYLDLIIDYI